MNEIQAAYYYDREAKKIWAVGEVLCWPSRTHIYTEDGGYLNYDDSGDYCAEWCERLNCETLEEAIALIRSQAMSNGVENKNIMFIYEEIDNVYANIDVVIENAGICYVEGNETEAQRYKKALEEEYMKIGKAVLENRDIAKRVQALLRGECFNDARRGVAIEKEEVKNTIAGVKVKINCSGAIIKCILNPNQDIKPGDRVNCYTTLGSGEGVVVKCFDIDVDEFNACGGTKYGRIEKIDEPDDNIDEIPFT